MGANLSYPEVDLSDKVVVITGGNAGIGYETTKGVAVMGAHTIIACRSEEKALAAIEQMKQEISVVHPNKTIRIEFMKLDLSSFTSTKDFTVAFKEKNLPLHILINNAGIFSVPFTMTENGNESHFQVNHLGHFLLTLELLPTILSSATSTGDGRIVILSSIGHRAGVFDPTNLDGQRSYNRFDFYRNSKLYNVMHGYALQRRLKGSGITVSSVHPGFVDSELFDKTGSKGLNAFWKVTKFAMKPIVKDLQQGAATSLKCAVDPELNSQEHFYYDDCKVTPSQSVSQDEELQEQLWEISIERVRDWLSPEILEKYGTRIPSQPNENRRGDNNEQQSGQGTTVQSDSTNKGTTDQSDSAANEPASGDVQENKNGDD